MSKHPTQMTGKCVTGKYEEPKPLFHFPATHFQVIYSDSNENSILARLDGPRGNHLRRGSRGHLGGAGGRRTAGGPFSSSSLENPGRRPVLSGDDRRAIRPG